MVTVVAGYGRRRSEGIAKLDLLRLHPFIDTKLMKKIEMEQLGISNPPVRGMRGVERIMQKPPEGVLKGESIPRENEVSEFHELYLKAKEQRIRSLEKQDRLKKEINE